MRRIYASCRTSQSQSPVGRDEEYSETTITTVDLNSVCTPVRASVLMQLPSAETSPAARDICKNITVLLG